MVLSAWLVAVRAPAGDEPLRIADVIRFVEAGISERTMLAEIQARGVGEALDDASEAALREAGASAALLEAVRAAAPAATPAPPPPSSPGGGAAPRSAAVPVFSAATRTVRVPVSVTDKSGRPITGLSRADFRVWEDGRPQEVTVLDAERKPMRIVVALDVSGSMEDKIEEVADSLEHLLELVEAADEVLVMTFSDRPRVIQDFTSDRQQLSRALERLRADGATALHDAVIEAAGRLADAPAEGRAVVLVTDGRDTASTASFKEAREAVRRSEVPVYSIGIGHAAGFGARFSVPGGGGAHGGAHGRGGGGGGHHGSGGSDFDAGPLRDLAQETGGRAEILEGLAHHHTGKVDRLKDAAEAIALALRLRYLLGYEPAGRSGKSGWRKIRVDVSRPKADVRARKGYYDHGS